jgi:hypothetical protein
MSPRKRPTKTAGPKPRTVAKAAPFPKCLNGHLMPRGWTRSMTCERCLMDAERATEGLPADVYRERRRAALGIGPPPAILPGAILPRRRFRA